MIDKRTSTDITWPVLFQVITIYEAETLSVFPKEFLLDVIRLWKSPEKGRVRGYLDQALSVDRKPVSSKSDELIVRLHVESLAMENLVSPFESDMLEIRSQGLQPISPSTPFHLPIPSGNNRNHELVLSVPPNLSLKHATLQIHYYNYQGEIPLNPPSREGKK